MTTEDVQEGAWYWFHWGAYTRKSLRAKVVSICADRRLLLRNADGLHAMPINAWITVVPATDPATDRWWEFWK